MSIGFHLQTAGVAKWCIPFFDFTSVKDVVPSSFPLFLPFCQLANADAAPMPVFTIDRVPRLGTFVSWYIPLVYD